MNIRDVNTAAKLIKDREVIVKQLSDISVEMKLTVTLGNRTVHLTEHDAQFKEIKASTRRFLEAKLAHFDRRLAQLNVSI